MKIYFLNNRTETFRDFPFQSILVLKVNACLLKIMIHIIFFIQSWKCAFVVGTTKIMRFLLCKGKK